MTAPPRLDLKEWSGRQDERFGPQESHRQPQPPLLVESVWRECAAEKAERVAKIINLGVRLMGDDAPHME